MTITTIAPGVRLLRRHPATDVLIVGGLGDWPTYFVESIPGGWCVVNGEQATARIAEQISRCEQGMMPEEDMMNLPDGWIQRSSSEWRCPEGDGFAYFYADEIPAYACVTSLNRDTIAEAAADLEAMVWALDPTRRADLDSERHRSAGLVADLATTLKREAHLTMRCERAERERDTAERQQADTFYALIAERKTSANLRVEARRLQERSILKRLLRRVVG